MDAVTLAAANAAAAKRFNRLRTPTVVLFGDSRTADCDYSSGTLAYSTNLSWWDWGQAARTGGPALDVLRNAGIGGNTTAQMLARFAADVAAYSPSYMTLWGGTNDGWTTTADVDASYGRMVQIMGLARAAGIHVFLISETTGNPPNRVQPFGTLAAYYNDRLRYFAATNPGVDFWDFNAVFSDPASATGGGIPSYYRDGLHPGPLGASLLGKLVVGPALSRLPSVTSLVNSQADTQNLYAQSRNVVNNPLMQGTAGTVGTGHTGTLPSSWGSSGNVVACSVVPRTDGVGNDLKAVLSATSTASVFISQTIPQARFIAGKRYVLEGALGIDDATNISAISLTCSIFGTPGSVEYRRGFGYPVQAAAAGDALATGDRVIRSRIFTAPADTYTGASVLLRIGPSAATATATVRLGRVSVRQLD